MIYKELGISSLFLFLVFVAIASECLFRIHNRKKYNRD